MNLFDLSHGLMASLNLSAVPAAANGDLFSAAGLVALVTLTVLEIVLGIDNVIFIAILAGRLPKDQQHRARQLGIGIAVLTRVLLLLSITWVMRLTEPLVTLVGKGLSGRDIILLGGGLFLIAKSTHEIHNKLEGLEGGHGPAKAAASLMSVVLQIGLVDIIFSLDSVITAVGISGDIVVMVIAIVAAAAVMLLAAESIGDFVEKHPTMKILALSFLILIGFVLVIEGWNPDAAHQLKIKNYAYFAMAFSVGVEFLNLRVRRSAAPQPVQLHEPHMSDLES